MTTTLNEVPVVAKSKVVSRNEFLAEDTTFYKKIPGFKPDTLFCLRSVSAGAIIEWQEANEEAKRTAGLRLIIAALVDGEPGVDEGASGMPLLTDKDLPMLRSKAHKITEGIVKEIIDMNAMQVVGAKKEESKNS
jgi:hypothetical protein